MTNATARAAGLLAVVMLSSLGRAEEAGSPRFLGPDVLGVAAGADRYPAEFGPESNVLWKAAIPSGVSSPCLHGRRIFLTGFDAGTKALETLCLDRETGKVLWRKAAP